MRASGFRLSPRCRFLSAFSLVEVVLAIGVIAFALLAVFALLPVGLNTNSDSIRQTEAAHLVSMVEADIRATPKGNDADGNPVSSSEGSPQFGVRFSPSIPSSSEIFLNEDGNRSDESGTLLTAQNAKYRVTLEFHGNSGGYQATPLRILVTWPAPMPPGEATGRFEVVTALDRN